MDLRTLEPEQQWLLAGTLAVIAVIGLLTWAGLPGSGDASDTQGDAPGEEALNDTPDTGENDTVEYDGAVRLRTWGNSLPTCADPEETDAVQLRSTEPVEGAIRFDVNGTIRLPDPCESLDATVGEEGGDYVLRITSTDPGTGGCDDCAAASTYTAQVIVPADRLTVMHGDTVVDVLTR